MKNLKELLDKLALTEPLTKKDNNGVIFSYDPSDGFCVVTAPGDTMLAAPASELLIYYVPTRVVLLLDNGISANIGLPDSINDFIHGCTYTFSTPYSAPALAAARVKADLMHSARREEPEQLANLLEASLATRYPKASWLELAVALAQVVNVMDKTAVIDVN